MEACEVTALWCEDNGLDSLQPAAAAKLLEAQAALLELARANSRGTTNATRRASPALSVDDRYRALIEQVPADVFFSPMEGGLGEAYVSPQIETILGFSQEEWLESPILWFPALHPDDKERWSHEAAEFTMVHPRRGLRHYGDEARGGVARKSACAVGIASGRADRAIGVFEL